MKDPGLDTFDSAVSALAAFELTEEAGTIRVGTGPIDFVSARTKYQVSGHVLLSFAKSVKPTIAMGVVVRLSLSLNSAVLLSGSVRPAMAVGAALLRLA